MKRVLIQLALCLLIVAVLSIALSSIWTIWCINETTLNTLFTLIGVLFSVGMSLVITNNARSIKNDTIRTRVVAEIDMVKNMYFICFFISCLLMVFVPTSIDPFHFGKIVINWQNLEACLYVYIAFQFSINFHSLYKLFVDIDNACADRE